MTDHIRSNREPGGDEIDGANREVADLLVADDRANDSLDSGSASSPEWGYGTADVSADGVDRSQLRRNRCLSPTERVEQMVRAVRILAPLQGAARRRSV